MTDAKASELGTVIRAECSECRGPRNCDVLGFHKHGSAPGEYFSWYRKWYILSCRGCDHVFTHTAYSDEDQQGYSTDEDGEVAMEYYETTTYWPALAKRKRPDWLDEIAFSPEDFVEGKVVGKPDPDRLRKALHELYTALDNDLFLLAGIGIRTCFDIAAELLKIKESQPFRGKLEQLVTDGHIGQVDFDHLEFIVEAGNASAHRGWKAGPAEISTMMDVLEAFLRRAIIEPQRRSELTEAVKRTKGAVPIRAAKKAAEVPGNEEIVFPAALLEAVATPENEKAE